VLIDQFVVGIDDDVLVRAPLLSRAITGIYDDYLRPFEIGSTQFILLAVIDQIGSTTRAELARHQRLDKSTLTRNLKSMLSEGWAEEVSDNANGRSRPLALTTTGKEMLAKARSAWLAAQARVGALLGNDGMIAVISTAERIRNASEISIADTGVEDEGADAGMERERNHA
jgi:DNA-binding MarR family transcriptional regulator